MATSLLPERIHPSGRRWTLNEASWRNGGALEKFKWEETVPAVHAHRVGATGKILEELGGYATMTHTLDPQLLERPIRILVAGCIVSGSNGRAIGSDLAWALPQGNSRAKPAMVGRIKIRTRHGNSHGSPPCRDHPFGAAPGREPCEHDRSRTRVAAAILRFSPATTSRICCSYSRSQTN